MRVSRPRVAGAFESIQYNPRARRQRAKVKELADVLPWFRRLSLEVEAIALGVDALYDRASQPRLDRAVLSQLLSATASIVPDRSTVLDQAAAADLRSAVGRTLSEATEDQASVAVVLDSVSLLGRLDQLVAELTDSALVPVAMGGDAHP